MGTTKKCSECNKIKDISAFGKKSAEKDGHSYRCKECDSKWWQVNKDKYKEKRSKYKRKWRTKNIKIIQVKEHDYYLRKKERFTLYQKEYTKKLKLMAIQYYSGGTMRCTCCPKETINPIEFLSIDHIGGGGNQHRKKVGGNMYRWLKANNYPDGFQVLCFNCNLAEGFYGKCPHKK